MCTSYVLTVADLFDFSLQLSVQKFLVHRISIAELRHMDDSHLEALGIPLGPRVRILSEVKKLVPLDNVSDVI